MSRRLLGPTEMRILQALRWLEGRSRRDGRPPRASWTLLAELIAVSSKTIQRRAAALEKGGFVRWTRRQGYPAEFELTDAARAALRYEREAGHNGGPTGDSSPGRGSGAPPPPNPAANVPSPPGTMGPRPPDRMSGAPRTASPDSQDMTSHMTEEPLKNEELLPADLVSKIRAAFPGHAVLAAVAGYPWVVQVATLERLLVARSSIHSSPAMFARSVANGNAALPEEQLAGLISYDRPDYDPFRDGPPKEAKNRDLWQLCTRFRDARSVEEARAAATREKQIEIWRKRDRAATADRLSREQCIELWNAVPAEELAKHGEPSHAENQAHAIMALQALKGARKVEPSDVN